jgi:hypothetical protein
VTVADYGEFTESAYSDLVASTGQQYSFQPYGTLFEGRHVIWRHDVDMSVHRARRLAEIETDHGVTTTYCFWLHSPFYNLLERSVANAARAILAAGHHAGLHFESGHYGRLADPSVLERLVASEAELLESILEVPVRVFSFHNPGAVNDDLSVGADEIAGRVNTYGRRLRDRYAYVSDSNGYWRHRRLPDVVREAAEERLHVLTHAEWWQEEAMAPRARVVRCVEGRAAAVLAEYDATLAALGRENIR